jgi:hypothetical protein
MMVGSELGGLFGGGKTEIGGGLFPGMAPVKTPLKAPPAKPLLDHRLELDSTVPVWTGPLSHYNTEYCVKEPAKTLDFVEKAMEGLVKTGQIDFTACKHDYSFSGRHYSGSEMSEFVVAIYATGDDEPVNKSIVEIRRVAGDSFVHEEFHKAIVTQLEAAEYTVKSESGMGSVFGSLFDFDIPELEMDPDAVMSDLSTPVPSSPAFSSSMDSGFSQELSQSKEEIHSWCEELFAAATNRDSYRETFRYSAATLDHQIEANRDMCAYLGSKPEAVESLLAVITDAERPLFDTLIIKSVVSIIAQLKESHPTLKIPANTKQRLTGIRDAWQRAGGVDRELGSLKMNFGQSQQVVTQCNRALSAIQQ